MFFELQDVRKRRQPTWTLNNTTGWVTAVDSTPSWNLQRGIGIGLVTCYFQNYLSHFINHCKLFAKFYEPPTNASQTYIWFKEVRKLDCFKKGLKDVRQLALFGGVFDIGLKIAAFRQFNSGWQTVFGGFQYSFFRKLPTTFFAFLLTSPFAVAGEMAFRAYQSDSTFPKQLQRGYKSFFDTLRRIPFEEGPAYLFRNSFPLYVKHILGPFTLFYSHDWVIEKLSVLWRSANNPQFPVKVFSAALSTYLAALFTYPAVHSIRDIVDLWPKKDGIDPFQGNYRRAAAWLWYGPSWLIAFPGFFHRYFWHVAPLWFTTIMLADYWGIFSYWRVDIMAGAGDNTAEDSYI